jgi:hypothetical protein
MIGGDTALVDAVRRRTKEHVMSHRSPFRAVVIAVLVLAGVAAIAIGAYQAGVAHGAADAAALAIPPEAGAAGMHIYVMPHAWHGGFFPFGPLFGLLIAFLVVRALLWGGPWRRGGCRGRFRHHEAPPDSAART